MSPDQYTSIIDHYALRPDYFIWKVAGNTGCEETFIDGYITTNLYGDSASERILALMECSGITFTNAEKAIDDDEYAVLTNSEAGDAANEAAVTYCQDVVTYEIPEHLQHYFDEDMWIADYLDEGRGHIIAHYDGEELYEDINGTTYYIYKR